MSFDLERDCGDIDVACYSIEGGARAQVEVRGWLHPRLGECTLHFGVLSGPRSGEWKSPLEEKSVQWPEGVTAIDGKACQFRCLKWVRGG